jgi:hypothetical protein
LCRAKSGVPPACEPYRGRQAERKNWARANYATLSQLLSYSKEDVPEYRHRLIIIDSPTI